jgi:hypothetical protein
MFLQKVICADLGNRSWQYLYVHLIHIYIFPTKHVFLKHAFWSIAGYRRLHPVITLGTDHLTWRVGLWFFVSFRIFFSDNTRVRIFIFFVAQSAKFFLPKFHIRLWQRLWIRLFFFFLHQNQNIFFSNIGNQNIFLGKNHNPPLKLNGRSFKGIQAVRIDFICLY